MYTDMYRYVCIYIYIYIHVYIYVHATNFALQKNHRPDSQEISSGSLRGHGIFALIYIYIYIHTAHYPISILKTHRADF